jgi:hypothetical protein
MMEQDGNDYRDGSPLRDMGPWFLQSVAIAEQVAEHCEGWMARSALRDHMVAGIALSSGHFAALSHLGSDQAKAERTFMAPVGSRQTGLAGAGEIVCPAGWKKQANQPAACPQWRIAIAGRQERGSARRCPVHD